MIDGLFNQPNYVAAKMMMDVTVLRQEAISSNLGNISTPNYKRIDVSPNFENQLKQAVASQDPGQIAGLRPELVVDTQAVSGRADGNTVQLESELLKLNQNMVEHTLETQLVTNSLMKMRLAIIGKN